VSSFSWLIVFFYYWLFTTNVILTKLYVQYLFA
jgi:hypothetical protein